jgi:hypothetical protein
MGARAMPRVERSEGMSGTARASEAPGMIRVEGSVIVERPRDEIARFVTDIRVPDREEAAGSDA